MCNNVLFFVGVVCWCGATVAVVAILATAVVAAGALLHNLEVL